jgi:hypothetical protein
MRQGARNLAREDRRATLYELDEVIGLLIAADQLPLSALASFESENSRPEEKDVEIWTEADPDRLRDAGIKHFTKVILGRSQQFVELL